VRFNKKRENKKAPQNACDPFFFSLSAVEKALIKLTRLTILVSQGRLNVFNYTKKAGIRYGVGIDVRFVSGKKQQAGV